jgi:hypothetical protein
MKRNEIATGTPVRIRPSNSRYGHNYGHNIGRIVSDNVSLRTVGYFGKTTALVDVEWYATLSSDGSTRRWAETRVEKTDSRKLEAIDVAKLAAEYRASHELEQAHQNDVIERRDQIDANLATIRAALGNDQWGYARNEREITLTAAELAAIVSKVVAS